MKDISEALAGLGLVLRDILRTRNNRNTFYSVQDCITIQDPYTKVSKQVPLLKPNEPMKTLGVWMQPDNGQAQ